MKERQKKDQPWLITYSDVITLLLVFFVLLISIVKVESATVKLILTQFSGNFSYLNSGSSLQETESNFFTLGNTVQSLTSETRKDKLEKSFKKATSDFNIQEIKTKKIRFIENNEGIIITLFTDIFFEGKTANLNYDSIKDVLEKIRLIVDDRNFQGEILINGHTDSTPYNGTEFKNNWELSVQRALQVFYAIEKVPFIYPLDYKKVSVHGYGDSRPVESNDTIEGRAYNRRVDIILKK